nr:DNA mismatch repair protein MSH6-like [Ipomoea batatas]
MRKRSEGTRSSKGNCGRSSCKNEASPSLTVSIKKEKEIASDAEKSSLQRNHLQNISTRTKHLRKKALNKGMDSKKLHIIKGYGKELVGAKVKVWWPLDKRFYEGVVSSFNPKMKKHKGILLKDMSWESQSFSCSSIEEIRCHCGLPAPVKMSWSYVNLKRDIEHVKDMV